jgi:hypothetical protein
LGVVVPQNAEYIKISPSVTLTFSVPRLMSLNEKPLRKAAEIDSFLTINRNKSIGFRLLCFRSKTKPRYCRLPRPNRRAPNALLVSVWPFREVRCLHSLTHSLTHWQDSTHPRTLRRLYGTIAHGVVAVVSKACRWVRSLHDPIRSRHKKVNGRCLSVSGSAA